MRTNNNPNPSLRPTKFSHVTQLMFLSCLVLIFSWGNTSWWVLQTVPCSVISLRWFVRMILTSLSFSLYLSLSLSRFGKKKDEKKEAKAALQRQKSDILSDHEFERMKEERERCGYDIVKKFVAFDIKIKKVKQRSKLVYTFFPCHRFLFHFMAAVWLSFLSICNFPWCMDCFPSIHQDWSCTPWAARAEVQRPATKQRGNAIPRCGGWWHRPKLCPHTNLQGPRVELGATAAVPITTIQYDTTHLCPHSFPPRPSSCLSWARTSWQQSRSRPRWRSHR